jgi:hypothetical protein
VLRAAIAPFGYLSANRSNNLVDVSTFRPLSID